MVLRWCGVLKDSDILIRHTALPHFHLRHVGRWTQAAHEGALQGQG